MAKQFAAIEAAHRAFIEKQRLFFVASAMPGARVNLSPKGLNGLRVLGPSQVVYLDYTGSGNETSAHLAAGQLADPGGLRLRGRADDPAALWPGPDPAARRSGIRRAAGRAVRGARQMVMLDGELLQTSCGFGVPRYDYVGERATLIT
jgi:hypothetical protein